MDSLPLTIEFQRDKRWSVPHRIYLQRLTGVRYLATLTLDDTYELTPTHGMPRQVTVEDLTNTDVWEELH